MTSKLSPKALELVKLIDPKSVYSFAVKDDTLAVTMDNVTFTITCDDPYQVLDELNEHYSAVIRFKFGDGGIMNTSPHDMHAFNSMGQLVVYEKGPGMVKCNQAVGPSREELDGGVPVVTAGEYTLVLEDLEPYKGAKTLLCSTILATHYKLIQAAIPGVRILVPDSGPSAKREGTTIIVTRFLEYC